MSIRISWLKCIHNMAVSHSKKSVLLVFAKSPEPGKVKTRLIPDIGVNAATNLYKELLIRTLSTSIHSELTEKQLWLHGDLQHSFFTSHNEMKQFSMKSQVGNDLGERMFNAFEQALKAFDHAILIGSDCPELTPSDLATANKMLLNDKDIVLGPSEDGGYYLIGLKKNHVQLFSNIEWGTEHVYSKTRQIAERLDLNIGLLEKRSDVDRVSDIKLFEEIKKKEKAG